MLGYKRRGSTPPDSRLGRVISESPREKLEHQSEMSPGQVWAFEPMPRSALHRRFPAFFATCFRAQHGPIVPIPQFDFAFFILFRRQILLLSKVMEVRFFDAAPPDGAAIGVRATLSAFYHENETNFTVRCPVEL